MFGKKPKYEAGYDVPREDLPYRDERMRELVALFDKWRIETITVNGEIEYLPHPLWDNEWMMTRNSFDTWKEAVDEVKRHKASLLSEDDFL